MRRKTMYWGAMITSAMVISIHYRLTSAEFSIFLYLCEEADAEYNIASLRQVDILENLTTHYNWDISKSTVSKSINALMKSTFITKANDRVGFMINPNVFYYGGRKSWRQKAHNFNRYLNENGQQEEFYLDEDEKAIIKRGDREFEENFHSFDIN